MSNKYVATTLALSVAGAFVFASTTSAADQINIVGSSTVFPFATTVADKFGKKTKFKAPNVISTGSGGGLKRFCKGAGLDTPSITNASRRIKKSEYDKCQAAGIKNITEVVVGYDGIVVANAKSGATLKLSRNLLHLALSAYILKDGKLVKNPNQKWSDVDPSLPDAKIEVLGPPPSSGTRDAFEELALEGGAKKIETLAKLRKLKPGKELDEMIKTLGIPEKYTVRNGKPASGKRIVRNIGRTIREDGLYIDAGENDNKIVDQLQANPTAVGVFGFSFLDQNKAKIKGASVGDVEPTFENIAGGKYPVSRSLFFYVKNAHLGKVPGIKEFVAEFVSDGASGDEGYLVEKGLIPLPAKVHAENAKQAIALTAMTGEEKLK